jgi:hypothetical protein
MMDWKYDFGIQYSLLNLSGIVMRAKYTGVLLFIVSDFTSDPLQSPGAGSWVLKAPSIVLWTRRWVHWRR